MLITHIKCVKIYNTLYARHKWKPVDITWRKHFVSQNKEACRSLPADSSSAQALSQSRRRHLLRVSYWFSHALQNHLWGIVFTGTSSSKSIAVAGQKHSPDRVLSCIRTLVARCSFYEVHYYAQRVPQQKQFNRDAFKESRWDGCGLSFQFVTNHLKTTVTVTGVRVTYVCVEKMRGKKWQQWTFKHDEPIRTDSTMRNRE